VHHPPAQHRVGLRRLPRHAHRLILVLLAALALGAAPAAAQPACGDVLTHNTTLTADLDCSHTFGIVPLTIGADGITVDLGGHHLTGENTYAIVNQGHNNVTIRNGSISSDGGTVLLEGVTGNTVDHVAHSIFQPSVTLRSSSGNRIVHNTFTGVWLELDDSDHNLISYNRVLHYEAFIWVRRSDYNRIVDNIIWTNGNPGLDLDGSHHNSIRRNALVDDSPSAVSLLASNDNELVANTIAATGDVRGTGANLAESSRNLVARNTFWGYAGGLRLRSGADNVFRRNDLTGDTPVFLWVNTSPDGMRIDAAATGTVIRKNEVRRFDGDGVRVDAPGTRIGDNSADDNGGLGFNAVPGVVDLGGNTASGNGNPAQCVNIFCG
jgi:parallel beta-helix repeat protein